MRACSGSQPRSMAKNSCSISASQKLATARPATVTTRSTWSSGPVAVERRHHAERDADDDRDHHRGDGQLDGGRQPRGEVVPHRPGREQAGAEVAGQELAEIVDQLHGQRPVEPELLPQQLDLGAGGGLARQQCDGIGRNDARDQEDDGDQAGERRHKPRDADKNEREDPHHVIAWVRWSEAGRRKAATSSRRCRRDPDGDPGHKARDNTLAFVSLVRASAITSSRRLTLRSRRCASPVHCRSGRTRCP